LRGFFGAIALQQKNSFGQGKVVFSKVVTKGNKQSNNSFWFEQASQTGQAFAQQRLESQSLHIHLQKNNSHL
jgi:hypothetical protein